MGRGTAGVNGYQVKILFCNDTTNTRITLEMQHGPDGTVSAAHSTPINAASSSANFPNLLAGDADTSKIVGEYIHPLLKIKHATTAAPVFAMVEVFEMRKPF